MRYLRAALVAALLLSALLAGAVVVGAQPDSSEEVRLILDVQSDGDARWHVVTRIPLTDEDAAASFGEVGHRFESGEVDSGQSLSAFETAVDESASATGREMRLVNVSREWRIVEPETDDSDLEGVGELELSFTWTNFSRDVDGNIVVDDAFNTTDGTWLPGLAHEQTLIIRPPDGYGSPVTAPVRPIDGELHWEGPTTFSPGYFEIVYEPGVDEGPIDTDEPALTTILLVGAIVLSLLALLLGIYLLLRRRGSSDEPSDGDHPIEPGGSPEVETEGISDDETPEPVLDEPDLDLLSDEERVERLLDRHGGRMKQAAIVRETGWSNAKVSQLLSTMDQEGQIKKLRIGRENLITLPDEDVGEFSEE